MLWPAMVKPTTTALCFSYAPKCNYQDFSLSESRAFEEELKSESDGGQCVDYHPTVSNMCMCLGLHKKRTIRVGMK